MNNDKEEITKYIDNQLDKMGFYKQTEEMIFSDSKNIKVENILEKIKESNIIDEILESLKVEEEVFNSSSGKLNRRESINKHELSENFVYDDSKSLKSLKLKLNSIKGLIDFSKNKFSSNSFVQVDILFLGQRFQSKKILISSDQKIEEFFNFDLNPLNSDIEINLNFLKKISSPIHIVLIKIENDEKKIISAKSIEWRWVLAYGNITITKIKKIKFINRKNNRRNIR